MIGGNADVGPPAAGGGWKQVALLAAAVGTGIILLFTPLSVLLVPGIVVTLVVAKLHSAAAEDRAVDGTDRKSAQADKHPAKNAVEASKESVVKSVTNGNSPLISPKAEAPPAQPSVNNPPRRSELFAGTTATKPTPAATSQQPQQQQPLRVAALPGAVPAEPPAVTAMGAAAAGAAAAPPIQLTPTRGLVPGTPPEPPKPPKPTTPPIANGGGAASEPAEAPAPAPAVAAVPAAATGGAAILARLRQQRTDTAKSLTPPAGPFATVAAAATAAAPSTPKAPAFPASPPPPAKPPVTILYGSQTGTCLEIARNLAAEAVEKGFNATCASLNELGFAALSAARTPVLVIVSSSTGDGDPPDNAAAFFVAMRRKSPPGTASPAAPLAGVRFTVLGLGDSNYTRFMYVPRAIKSRLAELGAREFYRCGEADEVEGVENIVDPWTEGLWDAMQVAAAQAVEADLAVENVNGPAAVAPTKDAKPTDTKAAEKAAAVAAAAAAAVAAAEKEDAEAAAAKATAEAAAKAAAEAGAAEAVAKAAAEAASAEAAAKAAAEAAAAEAVAKAAAEAAAKAAAANAAAEAAEAMAAAKAAAETEAAGKAAAEAATAEAAARAAAEAEAEAAAKAVAEAEAAVAEAAKATEALKAPAPAPEALKAAQPAPTEEGAAPVSDAPSADAQDAKLDATMVAVDADAAAEPAAGPSLEAAAEPEPESLLPEALVGALEAAAAPTAAAAGLPTISESRVFEDGMGGEAASGLTADGEMVSGVSSVPNGSEALPSLASVLLAEARPGSDSAASRASGSATGSSPGAKARHAHGSSRLSVDSRRRSTEKERPPRLQARPINVNFPKREETVVKRKDEKAYGMLMGLAPVGVDTKGAPALLPCRLRVQWERDEARVRAVRGREDAVPTREERHRTDPAGLYSATEPFWAHISDARYETAFWSDRKVIHLELSIRGSGMAYEPGDSIGVLPVNHPDLVANLCKRLHLHPDKVFNIAPAAGAAGGRVAAHVPSPCSVGYALTHCVDLTSVTRKSVLRLLAEHAVDAAEKRTLLYLSSKSAGGKDAYAHEVAEHQPSILDLLVRFRSVSPPFEALLDALPPLMPRMYSVSSSRKDPDRGPNRLSVALSVVRFKTRYGTRMGVATTWLDRLAAPFTAEGGLLPEEPIHVPIFLRRAADFKPPASLATPLIMIGPGTGVAPFRGFLQDRRAEIVAQKLAPEALGEAVLFFGCRRDDEDYLYKEDLEGFKQDGTLAALHVAFSRAQADKIYVQDLLKQQGERVWALLQLGAHVYVCGDGAGMAKDVHAALGAIASQYGGMSEEEATAFLQNLAQERRYVRDVWS